jgi:hypothetical protein
MAHQSTFRDRRQPQHALQPTGLWKRPRTSIVVARACWDRRHPGAAGRDPRPDGRQARGSTHDVGGGTDEAPGRRRAEKANDESLPRSRRWWMRLNAKPTSLRSRSHAVAGHLPSRRRLGPSAGVGPAFATTAVRTMVALADEPADLLLDPSCASGTILTEPSAVGWLEVSTTRASALPPGRPRARLPAAGTRDPAMRTLAPAGSRTLHVAPAGPRCSTPDVRDDGVDTSDGFARFTAEGLSAVHAPR